ncbi:MAG: hypothetical protein LC713_06220, partial [Actinobacteria bacterium]|nr:hypothetical protein [Actinomycetota bacterium]
MALADQRRRFAAPDQRWRVAVTAACVATIVAGAVASADGKRLGTALAPFFATWSPHLVLLAVPAALLFAAAVALAPLLLDRPRSPLAFAAAAFVLGLVLRLALAAARGGPGRWYAVFAGDPEAAHEYLPALPALSVGIHAFLAHFAEVVPSLPTHPSGHPPGMLILLDALGVVSARAMAALCVVVGALSIPLTYVLARSLGGERRARIAALFFVFAPSALLYGATSADALYATLGLMAAVTLTRSGRRWSVLGPAALAVASFFSFALLGIG